MFCDADIALDISTVNFDNVDEINDFAYALMSMGNSIGLHMSATPLQSMEAMQVYKIAKEWTNVVKRQLQIMHPAQALRLIDSYEIMHRIAFGGNSAKTDELNKIRMAAFNAMIRGDKSIDEYVMFRVIRNAVRLREESFFDKPLTWTCITEERWLKEALSGFDRTKLTDYDIISRISILLESDLYAFEGRNQDQFKQSLVEQHRRYLDGYTAPDRRTADALNYLRLISSRFIAV